MEASLNFVIVMVMIVLPVSTSAIARKVTFVGLAAFSFAIPFSLGHSQFVTGSLVNAALFCSAIFLPKKLFLPMVIFPGLAVLSRGLVFGPATPFLVFFLPFIWLANLGLVLVFKKSAPSLGFLPAVVLAATAKAGWLFLTASLFFNFQLVPRLFLQTMGLNQLITAVFGGLLVFVAWKNLVRS